MPDLQAFYETFPGSQPAPRTSNGSDSEAAALAGEEGDDPPLSRATNEQLLAELRNMLNLQEEVITGSPVLQ